VIGSPALIVLQARMGSTRLPGKVLAALAGRSVLAHCVERLVAAGVGPVVVATSADGQDDVVAGESARLGVSCVRGPLTDVLARFVLAADGWKGSFVVRATADNPAVDVGAPSRVLGPLAAGADYVVEVGLPVGAAVEGLRTEALRLAHRDAVDEYDREHVTPFIRTRPARFRVEPIAAPSGLRRPDLRLTVDTPADLAFVRQVFDAAGATRRLAPLADLIAAADRVARGGRVP
jgi:spore coat polysaccharide biosynthesis protein SpsF